MRFMNPESKNIRIFLFFDALLSACEQGNLNRLINSDLGLAQHEQFCSGFRINLVKTYKKKTNRTT
jgi:hypothetical protein